MSNKNSPLRAVSLGHSISRALKPTSKKALPEEKLSINDECEIKPNEKAWFVKMNVTGQTKQVERLLVVGPQQLRLLIPDTYEEVGRFPYKRMKEFSHNLSYKMFQFSWYPSTTEEETFYFHTSKCVQIQGAISSYIKELLKEQKIDNPDAILQKCTYRRAPQVERMKVGGRQRSTNSPTTKKVREKPSTQSPRSTDQKSPRSIDQKSPRSTDQKSPRPDQKLPRPDQKSPSKKPSILEQKSPRLTPSTSPAQSPEKKLLTAKSLPPEKPRQKRTPIKRQNAETKEPKPKTTFVESSESESSSSADSAVESV
jgi:hypothetical protein